MAVQRIADLICENSIAVVLPCHNEGLTIAAAVLGFQKALPGAEIIVFDNDSDDNTAHMARAAGAQVVHEEQDGKGDVVRRIFSDIEADLYVLAEADGSCDPVYAPALIERLIDTKSDMVIGVREFDGKANENHRSALINRLFRLSGGVKLNDVSSSYRVLTRRFVKSFPAGVSEFGIEIEMSLHAHDLRLPVAAVPIEYPARTNAYAVSNPSLIDRLEAWHSFAQLMAETRPVLCYTAVSVFPALFGAGLAFSALSGFMQTGYATQLSLTLLAAALMLAATVTFGCGIVLDRIKGIQVEQKKLAYLSHPGFTIDGSLPARPDLESETVKESEFPARRESELANNPVTKVA